MKLPRFTLRQLLLVVLLAAVLSAWAGIAMRPNRGVVIVLPDGYRDDFFIVQDSRGQDLQIEEGRYVFQIPNNGKLKVKNTSPFHVWHKETYRYQNGDVAVVNAGGAMHGDEGVTLIFRMRNLP